MTDDHTGPTGDPADDPARRGASSAGSSAGARGGARGRDRELMEAVAADLRAMRGRLDNTHELVHQHAGFLSEALPQLLSLGEQVAVLTGRVNALAGASADDDDTGPYADTVLSAYGLLPDPEHQVDWHLMSAEQAAPAWEALAAWVAAVVCGRLGFTRAQLPDCWALHPRAVAELSWAHQLHRTYAGAGVGAHQLADWHTRWLPQLQARLAAAVPLLLDDPLAPDAPAQVSDTAPRCRLGHFHQLSTRNRRTAELGLDQNLTQPDRPGGQRDRSRLTAATIPTGTYFDDALEAARRAIHERRRQAQQRLDTLLPRHGPTPDPARARYLPVFNVDAHAHADPAAEQPAHPSLWLPLYRDAAHHDLAARRRREQQPDQQRLDVTLSFSPDAEPQLGESASST